MNKLAAVLLYGLQQLLLYAPELFLKIRNTLVKENVTTEDLIMLRDEIERTSYSSIVTNTQIPPDQQTK